VRRQIAEWLRRRTARNWPLGRPLDKQRSSECARSRNSECLSTGYLICNSSQNGILSEAFRNFFGFERTWPSRICVAYRTFLSIVADFAEWEPRVGGVGN